MYRKEEEKRNPNRLERLIESIPLQIAETLHAYLQDYKKGEIDKKGLAKKMNSSVLINLEMACNSIDGAMGRKPDWSRFSCVLRKRKGK